jgi:hypothetical protein
MKTASLKVDTFRKRLALQRAIWAIELPAIKRITLELTKEQQLLLRRATNQVIPSLTLVLQSTKLPKNGHALACLQVGGSTKQSKSRGKAGAQD